MDRINQAFNKYPREAFLPADKKSAADFDAPIPIGYNQTNSQPTTVKRMLTWLDVQPGEKILDVGSGSGWTTALLSYLVGDKGEVYAVEKVPELVEFGRENCEKQQVENASFHQAGDVFGLPDHAPYDRILVSAAASDLPEELVRQLASGGRMVIPVQSSILVVDKSPDGATSINEHPGYAFVPLL